MSLVSILMGAFNDESSIRDAVQSIQEQSHSEWELIVVDDASTDETYSILTGLSSEDPRIVVLRNSKNLGLAATLNRAFEYAKGGVVARMDADDRSLPHRLASQLAFLEEHPEIDVVGTGVFLAGPEENLGIHLRPARHEDLVSQFPRATPFIHPSVMMRRQVLHELGGYDAALRRAQDFDLWWRGKDRFRYANIQEPLLFYRARPRPTIRAALWFAYAVFLGLRRDRILIGRWWYVLRPLLATMLARLRLRRTRLK